MDQIFSSSIFSISQPQVNMDGTALFVTVASIFIAQVHSIQKPFPKKLKLNVEICSRITI